MVGSLQLPTCLSTCSSNVSMCSTSGSILLIAKPMEKRTERARYLQCLDSHPRCSLAASPLDEQFACASISGTVATWDAATGLATNHFEDEV
jgi:hypothetical protein